MGHCKPRTPSKRSHKSEDPPTSSFDRTGVVRYTEDERNLGTYPDQKIPCNVPLIEIRIEFGTVGLGGRQGDDLARLVKAMYCSG